VLANALPWRLLSALAAPQFATTATAAANGRRAGAIARQIADNDPFSPHQACATLAIS
jgi:hypothetical protein